MRQHYVKMIADSEKRTEQAMLCQITDPADEYCGGFRNPDGLTEAKYAIYQITTMTAVYCNEESRLHGDKRVQKSISGALDYVARVQHDNGLFDYIDCNFLSAPDTAFCVKRLLPAYIWLSDHKDQYAEGSFELSAYTRMRSIIQKGVEGISHGGFHTPNHRWAIASILMECSRLFKVPAWKGRAEQYLNEGIDCNSDGEYAEKSAGNYNRINNDAMITLGDCTGDQNYYYHAMRNMRMMLTYFEPDGSIFTANSTRQDNGKLIYPVDYYTEYLRMGYDFGDKEFLDVANYIFDIIDREHLESPDFLMHLMNRPDLVALEHDGQYVRHDICAFYQNSGIMRRCCGNVTWTLLQGKSNFMYFRINKMVMELKIGGSFCEHRAFQAETMVKNGEDCSFTLAQKMRGWYYLPFESKPETTDWWKMDNASRNKLHGPDLNIEVTATEVKDADGPGIDIHIKAGGVKPAPFRIEIGCAGAERVTGDSFEIPAEAGGVMIGKSGMIRFENSTDHISIGPGVAEHRYIEGKFGSEKASKNCFTLYFTPFIPFDRIIKIRV